VIWACLLKGLSFELRMPDPASGGMAALSHLNPKQQMPILVDGGFSLYEMSAILIYLCEKHEWTDLLPDELEIRARVHQYLHFHHTSTRLVTLKLMGPHVTAAFRDQMLEREDAMDVLQLELLQAALRDPNALETGRAVASRVSGLIESGYLRDGEEYLCAARPTLADLAAYEDLGQLRRANLFDFEDFPRLRGWLDRMEQLPRYAEVHRYNEALGDILTTPNTLERFLSANAAGFEALAECGIRVANTS
jgi:glutathione S-transferase